MAIKAIILFLLLLYLTGCTEEPHATAQKSCIDRVEYKACEGQHIAIAEVHKDCETSRKFVYCSQGEVCRGAQCVPE